MVYLVSYFMNAVEKIIEFDKTFADGDRVKFSVLLLHKHNHRQINETTPPLPFPQINVEVHQMFIFKADLWEKEGTGTRSVLSQYLCP